MAARASLRKLRVSPSGSTTIQEGADRMARVAEADASAAHRVRHEME